MPENLTSSDENKMKSLRTVFSSNNMEPFTTSAQKLVTLPVEQVLQKLKTAIEMEENILFMPTARENMLKANFNDGSSLVIAAFEKPKDKAQAMIDHQNIPGNFNREILHKKWRDKIDEIFNNVIE